MAHNVAIPHIRQILNAIQNEHLEQLKNLLDEGCELNGNFGELNPLYLAIEMDKPRMVALLIEHGANMNLAIERVEQHTALHRAVMQGNKEIISTILQHTTSWDTTDADGASVLHLAMKAPHTSPRIRDREEKIIANLRIFLDLGANIEARTSRGETAVFVAARYNLQSVVKFLFERKADLNVRDVDGNSLIHCMLNRLHFWNNNHYYERLGGKEQFIRWLLYYGVDPNPINKAGESPMQLAINERSKKLVESLLEHLDDRSRRDFRDERGRTIFDVVLELYEEKSNQEFMFGYRSNRTCEVERIIDWLLTKGLSVDARNADGNTAIHTAAKLKKWFIVPKLLERYSDVNARNSRGQTALHVAIDHRDPYLKGYRYAVEALIAKGADIEIRDNDGLNAVQLAAKNKHKWILQLLKDLGSDLTVITASGENLLHLFASNDYKAMYELDPAKDDIDSDRFNSPLSFDRKIETRFNGFHSTNDGMVEMLMKEGSDINAMNVNGFTPLHVALEARNKHILKDLIEHGADVNFPKTRLLFPPIFIAAEHYSDQIYCKDIDILLQAGADINANVSGKTIVHHLVEHETSRKTNVIQRIFRAGAYCDVADESGCTPIYYAMKLDNYVAVAYLLEAGANLRVVEFENKLEQLLECRNIREYLVKYDQAGMDMAEPFVSSLQYVRENTEIMFSQRCQEEVAKMKEVKIDEHRSLCDFLRSNLRQRVYCINCEKLSSIVELSNLVSNFPLYCDIIRGKYLPAWERKPLLDDARDVLRRIVGFSLPDICVDNILERLDNVDLKKFIDKR